jgi:hypothetical protein
MAKLYLSQGKIAQVDDLVLEDLKLHKWTYVEFIPANCKQAQVYVCRGERKGGVYKRIYLHHILKKRYFGQLKGKIAFKNGNRLDYRKENLFLKGGANGN